MAVVEIVSDLHRGRLFGQKEKENVIRHCVVVTNLLIRTYLFCSDFAIFVSVPVAGFFQLRVLVTDHCSLNKVIALDP